MSVCKPCRDWLVQVLQEGLYDILEGCIKGMVWNGGDTFTGMILYEAHFRQRFEDIARYRHSCWICCQIWLILCNTFRPDLEQSSENGGEILNQIDSHCIDSCVRISLGRKRFHKLDRRRGVRNLLIHIIPRHKDAGQRGIQLLFEKLIGSGQEPVVDGEDGEQIHLTVSVADGIVRLVPLCRNQDENISQYLDDADTEAKAAKVKALVDECGNSHPECQLAIQDTPTSSRSLPTRLIEVGRDASETRLIECIEQRLISSGTSYATLSHTWGKRPFPSLNSNNYAQLKKNIPVSMLAKTFLEAIQFCREMGFAYLWIDSLCIIQNSAEDWNTESVLMHRVYGNSSLNIAAAASRAPFQGLFRRSQPILGARLNVSFADGFKLISIHQDYVENLKRSFDNIPLLKRGWQVQESFLAPRTLYWTEQMLVFRCGTHIWTDYSESSAWPSIDHANVFQRFTFDSPTKSTTAQELDTAWESIVYNYSGTGITVPGDRIVALAGIAARMHELYARVGVTTRYAAGCWEHNLGHWLQWFYPQKRWLETTRDAPGLITPSWSWLSSKGVQVAFGGLRQSDYFFRESIDLQVLKWCESHGNPRRAFANVPTEPLLVQTKVFHASCTDWYGDLKGRNDYKIVLRTDGPDEDLTLTAKEVIPSQIEFRFDEDIMTEETQFVKCALLKRYERGKGCTRSAMLIKQISTHETGYKHYRRIGVLIISYAKSEKQLWDFFAAQNLPVEKFSVA